jgi:hypothetical protein
MMSETTLLESRVDKIERDNRRLKLTVGALLLALAAVPLIGAVMPQEISDVIQAREFNVVDENGTRRVAINPYGIRYNGENGTRYFDENETVRASMTGGGIIYFNENGTFRASMNLGGIIYVDENGTTRANMGDDGFWYRDENENVVWSTTCTPNC